MRRLFAILWIVVAAAFLCACSKNGEALRRELALAPVGGPAPRAEKPTQADQRTQFLAYEHALQLNTLDDKVAAAYETVQAACLEAAVEECVVLRAALNGGSPASASLQIRARPAGLRKLMALLGTQGEIASQSMNAEDLGGPIEDGEKNLAMLKDYRQRLEDLRGRGANTIDSLIRVNQELAQVQSRIEAQAGESAHLLRRVDTELLNIDIHAKTEAHSWQPVRQAVSGFAANLASGISAAINVVAYALPFGVLLLALVWSLRRLWPRRRGTPSQTAPPDAALTAPPGTRP